MASLDQYILSYFSDDPAGEAYARDHMARILRTLELTPPGSAGDRALEMGAYMQMTPALHHRLGYEEVRGADLGRLGEIVHKEIQSSGGDRFACEIDLFDAERDRFPYPDGHFAVVLCCEVLEHLQHDPMAMMSEINRVTKPGGAIVMTTPNICANRGVAAILTGWQPQQFSQYIKPKEGVVDPKHSREYAPRELPDLLRDAGYETQVIQTGPCGGRDPREFDWVAPILKKHGLPTELREEGIYAVGRRTGPVRERYPDWLYA